MIQPYAAGRTGILLMLAGSLVLTAADALTKMVAESLPVGQLICLRGGYVVMLVVLFVWLKERRRPGWYRGLAVRDRFGQALRAACMTGSSFCFVSALSYLPLPTATSVAAAGPLFTTALAPLVLGERVGWRRWSAVAVGFAGVLVITRPTEGFLGWPVLLPLGAALFAALRDLITRRMRATDSAESMMLWGSVALLLLSAFSQPFGWVDPSAGVLAFLGLVALFHCGGQYMMVQSLRRAEAGLVVPFKYTMLVWSVLFGLLIWGFVPGWNVVAGALLIVASALYIYRREAALRPAASVR